MKIFDTVDIVGFLHFLLHIYVSTLEIRSGFFDNQGCFFRANVCKRMSTVV